MWEVGNVEKFDDMFYMCTSFNSDLSQWDIKENASFYGMFYKCRSLDFNLNKSKRFGKLDPASLSYSERDNLNWFIRKAGFSKGNVPNILRQYLK